MDAPNLWPRVVVLACLAGVAAAQTAPSNQSGPPNQPPEQQRIACSDPDPDRAIAACTLLIEAGPIDAATNRPG